MAAKSKSIVLQHGSPNKDQNGVFDYVVQRVTNSTEFHPRQVLTKATVDELCDAKGWNVSIVAGAFV